jgi:hypothetical protein
MYKKIIFVIFIVLIVSKVFAGDSPDYRNERAEVLAFMDKFCKEEFSSDYGRYVGNEVTFSRERAREEQKRGNDKMFFINQDPFVVVDSYEISEVYIKSKKRATVIVKYNRLSLCTREYPPEEERTCRDHQIKDEEVPYRLIKVKSHWKVLDPPFPRISLDTVIKHYSWFVDEHNESISSSSHLPDRTMKFYKREEESLKFFLKLRKKYPRLTGDKKPSSSS